MYNIYSNSYNGEQCIMRHKIGDVNGDNIPDNIYLVGSTTNSNVYVENITLLIQDGNSGSFSKLCIHENAGYNPTLFIGDFTGNGINDILISIDSGGSGGMMFHYIFSFVDNMPRLIFDFNKYNDEYNYDVTYKDNYRAEILSEKNNNKFILDLTLKGEEYLNEIYNGDGILKEAITGWVNPISGMYPVDFDYDGVYELLAYQNIAGRYNADGLGYMLNTLKWNNNNFELDNQNIAIWGSEEL